MVRCRLLFDRGDHYSQGCHPRGSHTRVLVGNIKETLAQLEQCRSAAKKYMEPNPLEKRFFDSRAILKSGLAETVKQILDNPVFDHLPACIHRKPTESHGKKTSAPTRPGRHELTFHKDRPQGGQLRKRFGQTHREGMGDRVVRHLAQAF
ncbi:hypothetical protein PV04_07138 [Phialophora macrospora]|uniref:Uncharacterized protein n=1 Tax=Phialophora macrospora TaxID=1851006 RepID=A0A0D2DRJ0_9EURO|nr:hypothetical protein PV04_07138 [Phialophora macrospora]